MEAKLEEAYRELWTPESIGTHWVRAEPAIPFVGDHYGSDGRPRVLVYGSAENLTHLSGADEAKRWAPMDRNRKVFERWRQKDFDKEKQSLDNWFPRLHITPISDGTLLTVARYLLEVFGKTGFSTNPGEFIQQIAVGNYGKFSLTGKGNVDYASKPDLLAASHGYVLADMEVLKPEVVIVPKTIHWSGFKELMNGHVGHRPKQVWRIYQTNGRVIRTTIQKQLKNNSGHANKGRPAWVTEWCAHVLKNVNMHAYLDWIDLKIATGDGSSKARWPVVFGNDVA